MSDDGVDRAVVPSDAPTRYDYVLAAIPAPVVAGYVAGSVSPLSVVGGLAAGSVVAFGVVAHLLFVTPPE